MAGAGAGVLTERCGSYLTTSYALGLGAGAETNGPLAVAVIGGMITSTLLTLVVVPAVYSLVENGLLRWQARHPRTIDVIRD